MRVLCYILMSSFGVLNGLETFYMENYCGGTVDMNLVDEYAGRLSVDKSYVGDCNVTVKARFTYDRLAFYFENFALGALETDCQSTFLTVYDGQNPDSEDSYIMHVTGSEHLRSSNPQVSVGLHKVCDADKPRSHFTSVSRYVTFCYSNADTMNKNHVDVIFTTFHKGYCNSYEYKCSNGRCIDDSVNCNGFNPCGDGSDCRYSVVTIVKITLGSLFILCVFTALAYMMVKNSQNDRQILDVHVLSDKKVDKQDKISIVEYHCVRRVRVHEEHMIYKRNEPQQECDNRVDQYKQIISPVDFRRTI